MKHILLLTTLLHLSFIACNEINLQDIKIPDFDDFEVIKEKCDRLGGNGTYERLKASKDVVQTCLQGFVDVTKLKDEIEAAKKTGSMDEVFGKYCAKRSKVETCVQNFTTVLKSCLEEEEKKALAITLDIMKQLGEFICFRDGDRIAMFIAEGGIECIKDHTEGIKTCVNSTLKITPNVNTNSLPILLIDKKKCDDLGKLQSCVVEELEKCKDSTPANVVDALFRFIKRSACTTNKSKRNIHNIVRRSVSFAKDFFNETEVRSKIMGQLRTKCQENKEDKDIDRYELLISSSGETMECLKQKLKTDQIFVASPETLKNHMQTCAQDLIKNAEACLSKEEKYFPQMYLDIFKSLVDFVYANKDKLSTSNLKIEMINCFQKIKSNEAARNKIAKCLDQDTNNNLQKEAVCGRITSMKDCVTEQLNTVCIRDVDINKLKDDFFNAITKPCNN